MNTQTIPPAVITFDALGVYGVTIGKVEYARCQKCDRLAESVTNGDSGYCADCTHGFDIMDEPKFESLDDLIEYHIEALKA